MSVQHPQPKTITAASYPTISPGRREEDNDGQCRSWIDIQEGVRSSSSFRKTNQNQSQKPLELINDRKGSSRGDKIIQLHQHFFRHILVTPKKQRLNNLRFLVLKQLPPNSAHGYRHNLNSMLQRLDLKQKLRLLKSVHHPEETQLVLQILY